ncbi:Nicotinate-nucleotide--dimethylbenzimidazole phosphoribosyltransferase [Aquimixticola soesokkakensis]|uniref:Nicotinate-nucleotide--dimethylbenzimidazole phosphoribosyltransferase n=1 Tax=Aquimixticola soesokkakensis TaxID=1519096 RepID=A0A1Y5SBN4_9RHOB|nr:Nicotinate-nucleotide--dimethylbenzimidazole phosphoribosyltransferase [Aquimixticola soesokkakensis]
MPFATLSEFEALLRAAPASDATASEAARARNLQLTKPPAALGRLEDLAIWYAGWRGAARPRLEKPQVIVFAGNHGITAQGVSAFPAEVTVQMVANFKAGGAAINQLAAAFGAQMSVVELDLERPTEDFTKGPAMSQADCVAALKAGWEAVDPQADLLVVGEMGIGNTTSAAAVACALFGGTAATWVGRGTGVDDAGLLIKERVVSEGAALHASRAPLEILAALGGRELAGMAGAIARARVARIPVILDGFICTAAAATLEKAVAGALDHAVAGHVSAEQAHVRVLEHLGKEPLLSLGMRLGEGSGAALAMGILKGAIACHSGMSTFAEAGVSEGA